MKTVALIMATLGIWGLNFADAVEPADSQIKSALTDIVKYEKQFQGKTAVNASTVKRTLKLLSLTRQRLDDSSHQTHESWQEADQRYKNLVARLNLYLKKSDAPAQDKNRDDKAQRPSPSAQSQSQPMISQYRVRIKKIIRDINSRFDTMDKAGVKPFQDSAYVQRCEQVAQQFQVSLDAYDAFKDDPDVLAASAALAKFNKMIDFGRQHAAKELAELGDVQARLARINQKIRQLKQPPTPQQPFAKGQLAQWLTQLAQVRQQAAQLYPPLPIIKQRAYLPDQVATVEQGARYDRKDVDRLERSLQGLAQNIDAELKAFGQQVNLIAAQLQNDLPNYRQFDPNDPADQANHFLIQGRADEIRQKFAQDLTTAQEIAHYAQLLKDPSYEQQVALVKDIQATLDLYEANYQKARRLVRMPKPASQDTELLTIAKRTLANYDYVGDIKRLVINAPKTHRNKETSEEKYNDIDVSLSGTVTLTGTKTTYHYEWDEFQVATAEPVDDTHYIFYSTLKYFTSGASTTPLNKWIIGARMQGCEIPAENIHLDHPDE